jgi:hypothetical protein
LTLITFDNILFRLEDFSEIKNVDTICRKSIKLRHYEFERLRLVSLS